MCKITSQFMKVGGQMGLIIRECPANGMLGGPFEKTFTVHTESQYDLAEISIEQFGERVITIRTIEHGPKYDFLHLYFDLKRLLMLLDGQFYPITSITEDGIEITTSIQNKLLSNYYSADFMIGESNHLINFSEVISKTFFDNWCTIQGELDIVHNMVLYCLSSVKIPVDMKCAFLIEAFNGVGELAQVKKKGFILPTKTNKGESKLGIRLKYIIDQYGQAVFQDECQRSLEGFVQVLINSRNRIAHIKSKQDRRYLNGEESVLYLCKLSLIYRIILLDLLNVPKSLYQEKLSKRIETVNNQMRNVLNNFLCKLK